MAARTQDVSVDGLRATCPELCRSVDALAADWLKSAIDRLEDLDQGRDPSLRSKQINDPIWRTVELEPREVLLLDSPLLQRMRGIRQLGLAHLVFPTANNDRFEHICGVVEASDRVFSALKANAERRRNSSTQSGHQLPNLGEPERIAVRIAALLHDVGHGPFSHAIEPVVGARYDTELKAANSYLMTLVHLDSKIEIGELISILIKKRKKKLKKERTEKYSERNKENRKKESKNKE